MEALTVTRKIYRTRLTLFAMVVADATLEGWLIIGYRPAQPLSDHQALEQTRDGGSDPAQRAGIRNHKVVIDSLLMIAEQVNQSRLLCAPKSITQTCSASDRLVLPDGFKNSV